MTLHSAKPEELMEFSPLDAELISHLDALVFSSTEFQSQLIDAWKAAESELNADSSKPDWVCKEVDLTKLKVFLPEHLRSHVNLCRVFILRRGLRLDPPERHRNSTQRLVSFRNSGSMQTALADSADTDFVRYELTGSDGSPEQALFERWNIVPPNTWHYPTSSPDGDWCTVTFHSAGAAEIIDQDWIY